MATKKALKKVTVSVQHPAHPEHSKWQDALKALSVIAAISPAVVKLSGRDEEDTAKAQAGADLAGAVIKGLTK